MEIEFRFHRVKAKYIRLLKLISRGGKKKKIKYGNYSQLGKQVVYLVKAVNESVQINRNEQKNNLTHRNFAVKKKC